MIIGFVLILLGIVILAFRGMGRAEAGEQKCLCHNVVNNPHEVCSDDDSYKEGHQNHLDSGKDVLGKCPVITPTPTVQPSVTPEPTDEVKPTPTPTIEPTDTPEATPSPKYETPVNPTFAGSSEAPQCGQTAPEAVVNPHVYRKGDVAIVKWIPVSGNKAVIFYKQVTSPDWQYSVTVDNTGYAEIGGLGTLDISFAVMAVNDCSGGTSVMSKVIVDGNTQGWVLFQ